MLSVDAVVITVCALCMVVCVTVTVLAVRQHIRKIKAHRAADLSGEVLTTREIVNRLHYNATGLMESPDYIRALDDVRFYDELHAPNR